MPLIIPANTLTGGYTVANSCRFNNDDSPYMHKTPAGAGNRRTFTISVWFKTSTVAGGNSYILSTGDYDGGEGFFQIKLSNAGRLTIDDYDQGGDSYNLRWVTPSTYLIRDPSAWYHLVVAVDSTDATESNRVKVYLNGTNISSGFTQTTTPSQNDDFHVNLDQIVQIGRSQNNDAYFDGYLAEFCIIDGSQLAATSFGEFDEDSPTIWKPIDVSGLTFGTNGFYLDFEASDNLGNDVNGGTDFTTVNLAATDQATDTPTNNFATMNPLVKTTATFSEGNLKHTSGAGDSTVATFGVSSGKWYFESKILGGSNEAHLGYAFDGTGIFVDDVTGSTVRGSGYVSLYTYDGKIYNESSATASFGTFSENDIIGFLVDVDAGDVFLYQNGAALNSGNAVVSGKTGKTWFPFGNFTSGTTTGIEHNFGGCPAFAISSGNADANGYGNFEYAVPSGYYALCTKNLVEYG